MSAIFLSHSSADAAVSARVKTWLAERGHRSVFLDFDPERGIPPGRNWEQELYRQLRACRAVVVLASEHSMASRWCFAEITQARSLGKTLIPVKVGPCTLDGILTDLQVLDLAAGEEEAFRRLAWALEVAGIDAADPFDWDGSRSPYPGFLAFQEEDAAIYFGRDEEIGAGLDALERSRWQGSGGLLAILGASGAGKSSLLRAGLLPRLRRDHRRWIVAGPFVPGASPLREAAAALARVVPHGGPRWQAIEQRLAEGGGDELLCLADELRLTAARQEAKLLLVVDQFEELLGQPEDHPAGRVLRLLRRAVEVPDGPLMALVTLRSDFLGAFQQHAELRGLRFANLTLGPMTAEGMSEVIARPAALAGVDVEAGLVNALVRDAEGRGALPLVAFTLRELYARYGGEGRLTAEQYRERLGGLRGAVAKVADSVLPAGDELRRLEADLRATFLNMVRVDEEGRYARSPLAWEEVPPSVRPLAERFVDARLLTSRGEERRTVEVAHEALFAAWDRLASWLEEGREALLVGKEVRRASELWRQEGRAEEYLWRRGRLQRALELLDDGRLPVGEEGRGFLLTGRQVETQQLRRRRRFQRAAVAVVGSVAVVMALLAFVAMHARERALEETRSAEIQAARTMAVQARTGDYPLDQALLLAAHSAHRLKALGAPSLEEARTSLFALLLSRPGLDTVLDGHDGWIWSIADEPGGRRVASGSSDGRLLLWDLEARRPLVNLDPCTGRRIAPAAPVDDCLERVRAAAFSPDGRRVAAGTQLGKLLLWEVDGEAQPQVLVSGGDAVSAVVYGADGLSLAAARGSVVDLWRRPSVDAPWPEEPRRVGSHQGRLLGLAFLAGDRALVSGGDDRKLVRWNLDEPAAGEVLYEADVGLFSFAASAGGAMAAGFVDGSLALWDDEGRLLWRRAVHDGEVRGVAFNADGRLLASGGGLDGEVKVWRLDGGEGEQPLARLAGHVEGANAVAFLDDGDGDGGTGVVTGAGDGELRLWNLEATRPRTMESGQRGRLTEVAIGDGVAVTGSVDGTIRIADFETRTTLPMERQESEVWGLALSLDGRWVASGSGGVAVRLWDRETGRLVFERRDHLTWVWDLAFHPDGGLLASADETGTVTLWDVPSGVPRLIIEAAAERRSAVIALAFSPAGDLLALGRRDGEVEVWSAATGQLRHRWGVHRGEISDLDWNADGSLLASASREGRIGIWRLEGDPDRPQTLLVQQKAAFCAVAFSPDGRHVASGDGDGAIRIWDMANGEPLLTLYGHQGEVLDLAFQGPGWLLSGGVDRSLRRWEVGLVGSVDEAHRRACALANRELEESEMVELFGAPLAEPVCADAAGEAVGRPPA